MSAVTKHPEIVHGTACFAGSRVPVKTLFDHLRKGYNVEFFLMEFPSVKRELVHAVLEDARHHAEETAQVLVEQ